MVLRSAVVGKKRRGVYIVVSRHIISMKNDCERFLGDELLQKASVRGNEFAWKKEDVIHVILSAKESRLASIGGQVQFRFPDGYCELYWINFDSGDRKEDELWDDYVTRSADEVIKEFNRINREFDLLDEGYRSFQFLKDKVEKEGVALGDYLCYVMYFNDENTYWRLLNDWQQFTDDET
jgi:hypothetical protein